jgi:hypothetical protein
MEHLRKFVEYIRETNPDLKVRATEELFGELEEKLLPHLLRVIQKDNTLFSEVELFPGLKWDGTNEAWKRLHMALIYSVLHGDPKEKFGKIFETVKSLIPGGSQHADEIEKLLNDEETQSSMKEMLELVMNTRLASLVGEIAQSLSLSGLDIDFENPEKILEILRNPQESPVLKEIADRAQQILKEKIETGKINQQELVREIETLRAKFQSAFGRYLNESLIGEEGPKTGNTSAQILSNHPEARRARMLARLQKKQKEKELRK